MPSTTTTSAQQDIQDQVVSLMNRGQEIALDAIKTMVDTIQSVTPRLPAVDLPFTDQLPNPQQVVSSGYEFAQKLLTSQREFATEVVRATSQLLPGEHRHSR